jgi:TPP-dependent pyruvate/acetoin dehydrogenase alpha subunit
MKESDLDILRAMERIAAFEAKLTELSQAGEIRGSLHLAVGQEALPVGTARAMRPGDGLTMTYRGHGYAVAMGIDLTAIFGEVLGREEGLCRGRGGKMHLFDLEKGLYGANGIVGGGVPTALGVAWAGVVLNEPRVGIAVFGDGALNQGVTLESLNLAAVWKLPVIFLCENNLYAEMTPLARSSGNQNLLERAAAFGMAALKVDGNDPLAVEAEVNEARERGLAGDGPTFIEAMTYRLSGHYHLDPGTGYRSREEIEDHRAVAPIVRWRKRLAEAGVAEESLEAARAEAIEEVAKAATAALQMPVPDPAHLEQGVFAA